MEIPSISLRRQPLIAIVVLVVGLVAMGIGLLISEFIMVFAGVLPVILAGLMMLNPFVVVSDEAVELRNVFGLTRAKYAHDGMHLLTIQDDTLYIQRGNQRAPIRRIIRTRIHGGDWYTLSETIKEAAEMRKRGKKRK
jgi:hypothetical protein